MPDAATLRDTLIASADLVETGVDGLYGRGETLERLAAFVSRWVMQAGTDENAEILRFPPVMPRSHFEQSGYFRHFPELVGTIHCFCGDEEDHRRLMRPASSDQNYWTALQVASDLVMVPAACYPVYPAIARRGPVATAGLVVDACSYCFRREPSHDAARMQMFRQHERIYIGTAEGAEAFRARWIAHAGRLATLLALPWSVVGANDAFFGRLGQVMARNQVEQGLKSELVVPVTSDDRHTACVSFNLHLTKMAQAFGLALDSGQPASTACVGFGLERLALAVFRHHGTDPSVWPEALRDGVSQPSGMVSL